ncbi:unnamed protein product [Pleuronectes platessa]|uniref:Uncharacterized protein n=1 Tax=Pleuronectes platessa TaxID=8262 RepID=A0A9N7YGC1_PLEPL|nr:unnamed protein product [Pleuronectes platessa]
MAQEDQHIAILTSFKSDGSVCVVGREIYQVFGVTGSSASCSSVLRDIEHLRWDEGVFKEPSMQTGELCSPVPCQEEEPQSHLLPVGSGTASLHRTLTAEQEPRAGTQSRNPRAGTQSRNTEQEHRAGTQSRNPEQEPRAGTQSRNTEQEPRAGTQSRNTEQEPRTGIQSRNPELEPRAGNQSRTPDQDPREGTRSGNPEQEPGAGNRSRNLEQEPRAGTQRGNPEREPRAGTQSWNTELEPRAGNQSRNPRAGTPEQEPRAGTQRGNPEQERRAGTQSWNPEQETRAGTPEQEPRAGTQSRNPEQETRAGTQSRSVRTSKQKRRNILILAEPQLLCNLVNCSCMRGTRLLQLGNHQEHLTCDWNHDFSVMEEPPGGGLLRNLRASCEQLDPDASSPRCGLRRGVSSDHEPGQQTVLSDSCRST